jgi:hypothetical protein
MPIANFMWVLLGCSLAVIVTSAAQDPAQPGGPKHQLAVSFGVQNHAERDAAYSPLIFAGALPSLALHYRHQGRSSSDHIHVSIAQGQTQNRFGAGMHLLNASLFTYKFYHRSGADKNLQFGWSNQNVVRVRRFADANNFNPRADVHTSFGPAMRYRYTPSILRQRLRLEMVMHLQAIGFLIGSDYVSPFPAGFTDRTRSGLSALWHSARLLYPGPMWHGGIWPQLWYDLSSGTQLGFSYRYDLNLLEGHHRSASSQGQYLFTLNMAL